MKCARVKTTKFKILQLKFYENFFQGYTLMIKQSIKIMGVKMICVWVCVYIASVGYNGTTLKYYGSYIVCFYFSLIPTCIRVLQRNRVNRMQWVDLHIYQFIYLF